MNMRRITDWLCLILGLWLAFSPWFLTRTMNTAHWIVLIMGLGVVLVSVWALAQPETTVPEWTIVILGLLIFFLPWIVGFYKIEPLAWNCWFSGVALLILAFTGMPVGTHMRHHPRT